MHIDPFRRDDANRPIPLETMQIDPVETMHESSYLRQKTQPYFPLPPNPIDSGNTKGSVLPNHSKFCFSAMGSGYWYSPV